jgi:hypothetical protein
MKDTSNEQSEIIHLLERGYEIGLPDEDGDAHRIVTWGGVDNGMIVEGFYGKTIGSVVEAAIALTNRRAEREDLDV